MTARLEAVFYRVFRRTFPISRELSAWDVPGWDSIANIELILEIEKEFGISFSTQEVLDLKCVGDIFDLLARKHKPE